MKAPIKVSPHHYLRADFVRKDPIATFILGFFSACMWVTRPSSMLKPVVLAL
jgi:hypothetical protein